MYLVKCILTEKHFAKLSKIITPLYAIEIAETYQIIAPWYLIGFK